MPDALAAPCTLHLLANQQPAAEQLSAVTPFALHQVASAMGDLRNTLSRLVRSNNQKTGVYAIMP
jgi:hypothetical protein